LGQITVFYKFIIFIGMSLVTDSGVGIVRTSLNVSLEDRYNSWNSQEAQRGPGAAGVDFMSNEYVNGFTPQMQQGASDIRNLANGVNGANFVYGNEQRIPREISDSITTTFAAGDANSIQKEFQSRAQTGITRFTQKGLNYLDSVNGFDSTKYRG
jgi:glycerate kinase